ALRDSFGWGPGDYWFPNIRSLGGAAIMLALVLYPYVFLLARAAFAGRSRSQFLAARSLGLTPTRAFLRVALPGARPAIAGGVALVLMETLADFGVAEYFAVPTFSTGIFRSWLAMGDKAGAMTLAAVMLLFVIALVLLEAATRRGGVESEDAGRTDETLLPIGPSGRIFAMLACTLPVIFGFVVPVATLGTLALAAGDGQGAATLWAYAKDSLVLAGSVAIVATVIAVVLSLAQRRSKGLVTAPAIRVATLGYALPGALLAVGLLAPLGQADQALTRFARDTFGYEGGLLLTGTSVVLVYALTVRFLTVAFNSTSGGFAKVSPAMDAAARSLGAGPARLFAKVQFPLVRSSLVVAGLLVFIDTLRELPATLILRPFNLETLATRVYRLASDERLAEAATASLLIVLAGLLPVILLTRTRTVSDR
ncbi:MAG: iron ABC transporter permease, partial [Pacificimonas sp.]